MEVPSRWLHGESPDDSYINCIELPRMVENNLRGFGSSAKKHQKQTVDRRSNKSIFCARLSINQNRLGNCSIKTIAADSVSGQNQCVLAMASSCPFVK